MHQFEAIIEIIGVNPYVFVPEKILQQLFIEETLEKNTLRAICG